MVSDFWKADPRRVTLLEKLIAEGLSSSHIAEILGTTKNAIIGRVYRNAMTLHQRPFNQPDAPVDETLEMRLERFPEPKGCRWITGDPKIAGWSWCNRPVLGPGQSYCGEHRGISYYKVAALSDSPKTKGRMAFADLSLARARVTSPQDMD